MKRSIFARWVIFIFTLFLSLASLGSSAVASSAAANVSTITILPEELDHAVAQRLSRVPEYRFISEEAQRMGVKVYLFGGTAAAFAHYVKWDLQREKGDARFQADRFDYDFTNIYRSNQDLDIVVDGSAAQIQSLQQKLEAAFPHFQGQKEAWEVRSLKERYNDKIALLNNKDFLDQNTDSNSVGMIEFNAGHAQFVMKDLKDWNNSRSQFVTDVCEDKLHYYRSPLHKSTAPFIAGKNPEIFSVIRFLIKAAQFELQIRPQDVMTVSRIIDQFDPGHLDGDAQYQRHWLEKNARKLIQNAVNIEYSWNLIEKLGLRTKLINLNNNEGTPDSMAWWLGREPLRSKPVGEGNGRTARELNIDVVAHETRTFDAYESITRAHTGEPNVLTSREGRPGENAMYGDAFYTKKGTIGAAGTGLTVRFHLDPEAKEGSDFKLADGGYVLILNKNALKVIPESLRFGVLELYRMLDGFDSSDKGVVEKLQRRVAHQKQLLTPTERAELDSLMTAKLTTLPRDRDLPASVQFALTSGIVKSCPRTYAMIEGWLSHSGVREARTAKELTKALGYLDPLSQKIFGALAADEFEKFSIAELLSLFDTVDAAEKSLMQNLKKQLSLKIKSISPAELKAVDALMATKIVSSDSSVQKSLVEFLTLGLLPRCPITQGKIRSFLSPLFSTQAGGNLTQDELTKAIKSLNASQLKVAESVSEMIYSHFSTLEIQQLRFSFNFYYLFSTANNFIEATDRELARRLSNKPFTQTDMIALKRYVLNHVDQGTARQFQQSFSQALIRSFTTAELRKIIISLGIKAYPNRPYDTALVSELKARADSLSFTRSEQGDVRNAILKSIESGKHEQYPWILQNWFEYGGDDSILEDVLKLATKEIPGSAPKGPTDREFPLLTSVLGDPEFRPLLLRHPDFILSIIKKFAPLDERLQFSIGLYLLNEPGVEHHPELVRAAIDAGFKGEYAAGTLMLDRWYGHPELVEKLLARHDHETDKALAWGIGRSKYEGRADWIGLILDRCREYPKSAAEAITWALQDTLRNQSMLKHPELVEKLVRLWGDGLTADYTVDAVILQSNSYRLPTPWPTSEALRPIGGANKVELLKHFQQGYHFSNGKLTAPDQALKHPSTCRAGLEKIAI